jgi:DNA-binding response OmpR family regulator
MKILIVEDDLSLADVLSFTLRRAGFSVVTAHDGLSALEVWRETTPDLVLLDLNLPKLDGISVCRQIRAQSDTPIIMLTVRSSDEDVVQGLEMGADDYVVKPFSPSQLLARMRAVLRRSDAIAKPSVLTAARLSLDRSRNEVERAGHPAVRLTPLEVRLLETLMLNAGHVLSAEALIDAVWGVEGGDRGMLKQLVYRLRSKIEPDPSRPVYIETVPGIGYALIDLEDER